MGRKVAKAVGIAPSKPKPAPAPAPAPVVKEEPVAKTVVAAADTEKYSKLRSRRGRAAGYASLMTSGRRDETLG